MMTDFSGEKKKKATLNKKMQLFKVAFNNQISTENLCF